MKTLALLCASTVAVSFLPMAASADEHEQLLTPNQVAHLAYRGEFKEQGIPSYGVLCSDVIAGAVSGTDVAKAAVEAEKLAAPVSEDFVNALSSMLLGICRN